MKKFIFLITCIIIGIVVVSAQEIKGTYAIKNAETGIFIRIKDADPKNGTPIVAYSPVNWKCVTWDFKKQEGDAYQLVNLFSRKTMQPLANPRDGTNLEEQPLISGNINQQYDFIPVKDAMYLIRLKGTELYLTPADNEGDVNSLIVLKPKSNARLQLWQLIEQHPEI